MTAAQYLAEAATLATATLEVRGATEQQRITGIVHEYEAVLP